MEQKQLIPKLLNMVDFQYVQPFWKLNMSSLEEEGPGVGYLNDLLVKVSCTKVKKLTNDDYNFIQLYVTF